MGSMMYNTFNYTAVLNCNKSYWNGRDRKSTDYNPEPAKVKFEGNFKVYDFYPKHSNTD